MKKRLLSILTALCLCLTLLPGTVLANEGSGAVLAEEGGEAETAVSPLFRGDYHRSPAVETRPCSGHAGRLCRR